MIQSMTGFGSGRSETAQAAVSVEVKTVNHRFLDVNVRVPADLQPLETMIRKKAGDRLRRGRVDVFVRVERRGEGVRLEADPELIASYVDLVRDLKRQFPISGDLTIDAISRVPGAINVSRAEVSAGEQETLLGQVEEAVEKALYGVVEMRRQEGEALVRDLMARTGRIRSHLERIRDEAKVLVRHYQERLTARLAEMAPSVELDRGRLEMEALIYADKSDIAEELTRLESHLNQFDAAMDRGEESGKRLDFLLQEMNREVTTILSKTSGLNQSGAAIGEAAIDSKVEIDKLREQVQNVE